jgi:hypothetical protein
MQCQPLCWLHDQWLTRELSVTPSDRVQHDQPLVVERVENYLNRRESRNEEKMRPSRRRYCNSSLDMSISFNPSALELVECLTRFTVTSGSPFQAGPAEQRAAKRAGQRMGVEASSKGNGITPTGAHQQAPSVKFHFLCHPSPLAVLQYPHSCAPPFFCYAPQPRRLLSFPNSGWRGGSDVN